MPLSVNLGLARWVSGDLVRYVSLGIPTSGPHQKLDTKLKISAHAKVSSTDPVLSPSPGPSVLLLSFMVDANDSFR